MSIAVPLALVSRRRDVLAALEGDPGATRYAITLVDPANPGDAIAQCSAVIVDGPGVDDAPALARKLRREHSSLEQLAIVADERAGVDAIRLGAYDFVSWPPREPPALWTAVASLVDRVGPPRRGASGTIGGYRLLERLGSGGMADVFLAQKPGEDPLVLKCMRPEIAEEERYVAMFLEEARISQALSHPNIVRVYDAGGTKDELFIAMEYVPGRNLAEIGKQAGWRFPPALACWIAAEVAAALDHAHGVVDTKGSRVALIHRDVNPPNVLIRDDGAVKLADFGIAKTKRQHGNTTQGVLRGKLEYMSPEQVDALPLDARTDVFSLGAVLYQLLTGEHPFLATTTLQTLQRIQQARCEPPSSVYSSLPMSLDPIVMKALARDRDERYVTARALESDLRAWIAEAGGASREDLAAFVRDAVNPGVVPRGGSERGRETFARMPSVVTVLSPPRAVANEAEPTVTTSAMLAGEPTVARRDPPSRETTAPPSAEPTVEREISRSTVEPRPDPTVEREISRATGEPKPEPTVEREVSRSTVEPKPEPTVEREVSRSTVEPEPPLFPDAVRPVPRGDRDTVRRPAIPAPPVEWRLPVAVGGGAFALVILAYLVNPFEGTPSTTPTPRVVVTPSPTPIAIRTTVTPARTETPAPGTPLQTSRPAASPTPTRTVTPPATRVAVASPTPRPLRKGRLSILLQGDAMWAAVSIDGKSLGQNAPVVGLEVLEGKHRVTLENPPLKLRREYDVVIVPDEEFRLRANLRQGSGL